MRNVCSLPVVMAGLDPAIHEKRHVDARIKSGHDGSGCGAQG